MARTNCKFRPRASTNDGQSPTAAARSRADSQHIDLPVQTEGKQLHLPTELSLHVKQWLQIPAKLALVCLSTRWQHERTVKQY